MNIRETLNLATKKLKNKSTSPSLDAEVLLSFVLKKSKEYIYTNYKLKILNYKLKRYNALIKKRAAGWPVAYLTNHQGFYGLDFYVDKNVLIPRPSTEELVELAKEYILKYKRPLKILDVGTGSGCIIIALGKQLSALTPQRSPLLFASDISLAALKIAKRNAKTHRVKISFKQSDLLTGWKKERFDIIIANLPYLPKRTDPSTKFEPTSALIAKNHGLALIERLLQQATSFTPHPSELFLEMGHDQGPAIKKLAAKLLPAYKVQIIRDLTGRVRFCILIK